MKSLIAVTVAFVFTIAVGVAGKPSAFATDQAIANARAKQPIMLAEQELPFDRYWSKN